MQQSLMLIPDMIQWAKLIEIYDENLWTDRLQNQEVQQQCCVKNTAEFVKTKKEERITVSVGGEWKSENN